MAEAGVVRGVVTQDGIIAPGAGIGTLARGIEALEFITAQGVPAETAAAAQAITLELARQVAVAAQREGGGVHHLQVAR